MNLALKRFAKLDNGIFGFLFDGRGNTLFVTMEHSYDGQPKLPDGAYLCKRSMHRLHGMTQDFETFEIMGVPGHTGILFHWGNYNADSNGCVLVGEARVGNMVTNSRAAFAGLMALQAGCDEFQLTVS